MNYSLTVSTNPGNAAVTVNGTAAKGNVWSLPAGNYSVVATAPGYNTFNGTVTLNANMTYPVTLTPMLYNLSVAPNPGNATVSVNGAMAKGNTWALAPGNYSVSVTAPGYNAFNGTVTLNANMTYPVTLTPSTAGYQVQLPAANINPDVKGGHYSQMALFVDGAMVKDFSGQLVAGTHTIKVVSGGMQATVQMNFEAGRNYVIEPFMGVNVK